MAVTYKGLFGSNQSKTAGTSLQINPTDITVAVGEDIFVAFASDDVGTGHGVTHGGTSSITWTLENSQIDTNNERAYLFRGSVIGGGSLTDLTVSWTTNINAKAAVAGWYSGVGTLDGLSNDTRGGADVFTLMVDTAQIGWQLGDLAIGASGWEIPQTQAPSVQQVGTTLNSVTKVGQNGTTGGGAATNIVCILGHGIANATNDVGDNLRSQSTNDSACSAGAVYSAAAAPQIPNVMMAPYIAR